MPLSSIHPLAIDIALASRCVWKNKENEKYFSCQNKLFENQEELTYEKMINLAKEIGKEIKDCVDKEQYKKEIEENINE